MDEFLGQLLLFSGSFVPVGYLACNGQTASATDDMGLFDVIGTTFGGNGRTTFSVPNLPPVTTGNGATMHWAIATSGTWPYNGVFAIVGQVRPFPFPLRDGTVLQGAWLPCDGRLVDIQKYQGLFALLGTTFGGDGKLTFALPTIASLKSANGAALPWYICINGIFPQTGCDPANPIPSGAYYDFMLGSVCHVAMAPSTVNSLCQFALCNGQSLPVAEQWSALFSLVGTGYGPSSATAFSLPNIPTAADQLTSLLVTEGYFPERS